MCHFIPFRSQGLLIFPLDISTLNIYFLCIFEFYRLDNILSGVPLVEKLVNKLVLALEQLGQIPALLDVSVLYYTGKS